MDRATLLVELGTEELPPKALLSLAQAFRDGIVEGLAQHNLACGEARYFATPRRLAVLVEQVQLEAADQSLEVLGPPADKARDAQGNWTAAAAGFARKQGVEPDALASIDTLKGPRLGLHTTVPGARAGDVLGDVVRASVSALPIPRRMRWGASREEFVRPAHWFVAMLGAEVQHCELLGLRAGNTTLGHRFLSNGPIALQRPEDYEAALGRARVIASFERRRSVIRAQVEACAAELGARAEIDPALLDEVTALVEWPVALAGNFDKRFLEVPQEALISSMKEHQKYFHLVDGDGALLPHFITVANIDSPDPAQIIAGNERVIRPRLADAAFFFETDCKTPLEQRLPALDNIVFQQQLGTLGEKSQRVAELAALLAPVVGADPELARRAGVLCKADLVADMVLEFPDMQGIAGSYYALHDGEPAEVAAALAQQYWPKFAGDRLPESPTACALALADRLDTLVGIFGIGQPPTGSRDPFALRRASLAVLRILVDKGIDLDLRDGLSMAAARYPGGILAEGTTTDVLTYMIERFRAWYEEEDIPVEVFRAVSSRGISRPLDIQHRVQAVHAFAQLPQAQALAAANKRVSNILGKLEPDHRFAGVDDALLAEAAEQALAQRLGQLSSLCRSHLDRGEYTEALTCLAQLREPVDAFFDDVMVNVDEPALRDNRLNLLKQLRDLFLEVADISLLAV